MILQKKRVLKKCSYIYYEYYKTQKTDCKFFLCFKNWLGLVILITKYGVISAKESANTNQKKRKSSLEARKMKLEGWFFCENAYFYLMNSNQAENQSFENRTL